MPRADPVNIIHGSKVYIRSLFDRLRRVRQPCRLCLQLSPEPGLCRACARELAPLPSSCPVCAEPDTAGLDCGRCQQQPPPVARCIAAGAYQAPVADWIKRLKFHGDLPAASLLGALLAGRVAPRLADRPAPDALVPMPLHPRRLRQRGYNQALELGRVLGQRLELPIRPRLLHRVRDTRRQSGLPARQRAANVRQAFHGDDAAAGLRLALVDDVMTTGETAYAAARALRRAGATEVEVWVIARAARR